MGGRGRRRRLQAPWKERSRTTRRTCPNRIGHRKPFAVVAIAVLTVFACTTISRTKPQRKDVPNNNRLKWYAEEARKEGKQKQVIPAGVSDYLGSDSPDLERSLSIYSVVVAQPVRKRTFASNDNSLSTWYKFSIVEALTPLRDPVCAGCVTLSPPLDMRLDQNEFVMLWNGGTLTIDGVEIEQRESGFPEFQEHQKYLMFISLYPNQVAITAGGPLGVFEIGDKETLTAFSKESNPIRDGVERSFNNSLGSLKQRLKSP